MNTQRFVRLIAYAAVVTVFAVYAEANLLTNGSFEMGILVNDGNHTQTFNAGPTAITGWTAVGRQVSWIDAGNPFSLSAQDGNRFLDLTAYNTGAPFGGVTQTVSTTAGQQYTLSFFLGSFTQLWGGPPISILATAGGTSQTFTLATPTTSSTWAPFSLLFTAASASTAITLTGAAGVEYIGLDNASVDPAGAGGVPEPATWSLLAVAAGLFAATGRRFRLRPEV